MKTHLSYTVKGMRLFALLLALIMSVNSHAQTFFASGSANNVFQASPVGPLNWMNNAEFKNNSGTLYGVTWDDGSGTLYLRLLHSTHFLTQTLGSPGGSMRHPDIVLGGDATHNYVCVVYTATVGGVDNVYADFYTITFPAISPFIACTATCSAYIIKVSNNSTAGAGQIGDAHVDLINKVSGTTVLADIIGVCWEDILCKATSTFGVAAAKATFSNVAACGGGPYFTLCPAQSNGCINNIAGGEDGVQPDITGFVKLTPPSTFNDKLGFVYYDPNTQNLNRRAWDLAGGTLNTSAAVDNGVIEYPRIDAVDQPTNSSFTDGALVYMKNNGTTWDVIQYNALNSQVANSYYGPTTGVDNVSPVVTSGPAGTTPQTTIAYETPSVPMLFAQNVLWSTGTITSATGPSYIYREVELSLVNGGGIPTAPVALSNSWIYGASPAAHILPDEVWLCWYDASNDAIDYKITTNMVFKPTNVNEASLKQPRIYPNPADDMLYIDAGSDDASFYTINDLTGRVILKGAINNSVSLVDTKQLANGIYMLYINYKDNSTGTMKFVKE